MNSFQKLLRSTFRHLVTRFMNHLRANGEDEEAIRLYEKAVEVEGTAEEFYQNLMECYRDFGQREEAIATYHRCEEMLAISGSEPCPITREIYQNILLDTRPACA